MIPLPEESPILVVDDSEADLMITETVLERSGLSNPVEVFSSGEALIERMEQVLEGAMPFPILLLVDVNMPRLSGFDVLRDLRGRPEFRKLPVIMLLSSSDAEEDRARARGLGADDYLVKASGVESYVELIDTTFVSVPGSVRPDEVEEGEVPASR